MISRCRWNIYFPPVVGYDLRVIVLLCIFFLLYRRRLGGTTGTFCFLVNYFIHYWNYKKGIVIILYSRISGVFRQPLIRVFVCSPRIFLRLYCDGFYSGERRCGWLRSQYYFFLHTIRMIICYFLNTTRAKPRNVQGHVASKRNGANDFRISRGVEIFSRVNLLSNIKRGPTERLLNPSLENRLTF